VSRATTLPPPLIALAGLALGAAILGQALFLHPEGIPDVVRLHDHIVHSIVYGAVGAALAWWSAARSPQRGPAYHLALVQLVALHLGLADEVLQSTSLGREASPHDLIADATGSFAGAVMILHLRRPAILLWTRRTALAGGVYLAGLAVALALGNTPAAAAPSGGLALPMATGPGAACGAPAASRGARLQLDVGSPAQRAALVEGWSVDEQLTDRTAAWSEGARSRLEVVLPARRRPQRLTLVAMGVEDPAVGRAAAVLVRVNGARIGRLDFGRDFAARALTLPAGVLLPGTNAIELEHLRVYTPPGDGRALSIMLDRVCLDSLP
jgi:VanZ family protein